VEEKRIRVGLVGFGTVGSGVAKLILEEGDAIAAKMGVRLELACVVDPDLERPRPVRLPDGVLGNNLATLLTDPTISVGVELVGGTGVAKDIQIEMLKAGKDVVTANKALLAEHGAELYRVARENDRCIAFEASCAGGIPIIGAIRTGLAANDISAMYGIVNGTCNYILSNMSSKDEDFSESLAQAQQRGYAEADPTLDITGGDSAHKLAILASFALGYEISLEDIFVEGIERIAREDIQYGREMGYCLKRAEECRRQSVVARPSIVHRCGLLVGAGQRFLQCDQYRWQRRGRNVVLRPGGGHDANRQRRRGRHHRCGVGQLTRNVQASATETSQRGGEACREHR